MQYIFFTTDESFSYNGPFGTATQYETGLHGIEIDFDKDYRPVLSSVRGFGYFANVEDEIKDFESLKSVINVAMEHYQDEIESTPLWLIEDLYNTVKEEIENSSKAKNYTH